MNLPAVLGLLGSGLLAIPAIRQEKRRRIFTRLCESVKDPEDRRLIIPAAERHMSRNDLRWNAWDSTWILLGLFFIVLSFLLEIFQ